jgi:type III secretion protein Y
VTTLVDDAVHMLHAVGYLYGHHGQTKRAIVLLLIAARLAPDNVGVLRTLAYAFLIDGSPHRAIAVVDQLRSMREGEHPVLDLLACRALWACGRQNEARLAYRAYVARHRRQ